MPNPKKRQAPPPMSQQVQGWKVIDPQLSSPLYNGRIPAEIRSLIFEYAVSESTIPDPSVANHDFCVRYDHEDVPADDGQTRRRSPLRMVNNALARLAGALPSQAGQADPAQILRQANRRPGAPGFDWLRPGFEGRKVVHCGLLSSCRRTYLETSHLPAQAWTGVVFLGRGPPWQSTESPSSYFFHRLPRAVRPHVRSLHLIAQMFRLEELAETLSPTRCGAMGTQLERLRLTVRRGDWWYNESNVPLAVYPFRRVSGVHPGLQLMRRAMAPPEEYGGEGDPRAEVPEPRSWGAAFAALPALRELVMDFETSEDKKAELDAIARWAATWRFPLDADEGQGGGQSGRRFLSAEGNPVRKMSWTGLPYHWSDQCPECGSTGVNSECAYCQRRLKLASEGKGPRLYVWTLTWTARSA
ncbi:hypothetical protein NKR23_g9816 [Pleurostoma richardsiae]|uniref:Uncharacterized protein n=1 Tax=Pleurostoma richardsiae TaxID=41990 RepID=A0AA38VC47_9PEZI|nr:hypothetical protein NKR23_g9816 [Pleurostoma richardsiae]